MLGVAHSNNTDDVMFPQVIAGTQKRSLAAGDRVAISALYDNFASVPGLARDLGIGADGSVWHIGTSPSGDGYRIYKWTFSGWSEATGNGGAYRIAVAPDGTPWVVTLGGSIFTHSPNHEVGGWSLKPGCAKDIGIGSSGAVWVVGCDLENPWSSSSGHRVHKWNGVDGWAQDAPGTHALRISVDDKGNPWIVNHSGAVYKRSLSAISTPGWTIVSGIAAWDIGISPDGFAWAIGQERTPGGYKIYVRNDQNANTGVPPRADWIQVRGGAITIAAGPRAVWVANEALNIYKQNERSLH